MGWLTPTTINARVLIQTLHREKYSWDVPIKKEHVLRWKEIFSDLQDIGSILIPRFIISGNNQELDYSYHVFADASQLAYACAVYLRTEHKTTGKVETYLLYTRARVAPIIELSIPRLELLATLIATRALQYVQSALPISIQNSTIWSDSLCVLYWINNRTNVPRFVQNRLNEIRESSQTNFKFVRSEQNPADLPSRGCTIDKLKASTKWWNGPDWLKQNQKNWPSPWSERDEEGALKTITEFLQLRAALLTNANKLLVQQNTPTNPFGIQITDQHTYKSLLRTTAYCIAFLRKFTICQRRNIFQTRRAPPVFQAYILWIKTTQQQAYNNELLLLTEKRRNQLISKLRLFIDDVVSYEQQGVSKTPLCHTMNATLFCYHQQKNITLLFSS